VKLTPLIGDSVVREKREVARALQRSVLRVKGGGFSEFSGEEEGLGEF